MLGCKYMKINRKTGILEDTTYIPSPNSDERPAQSLPELVVVHNISLPPGEFGGPYIGQLFTNQLEISEHPFFEEIKDLQVSSHLLIRRNGTIVQFVPFHKRAWHAGESCHNGRERCNDYSIGIELEGTDETPYTEFQYEVLNEVIAILKQDYPLITDENIVGHCDIAPQRKTDPGPSFEWARIKPANNNNMESV